MITGLVVFLKRSISADFKLYPKQIPNDLLQDPCRGRIGDELHTADDTGQRRPKQQQG